MTALICKSVYNFYCHVRLRYFRESWAMAVFHDRFPDFRDEVRELLMSLVPERKSSLEQDVRTLFEDDSHVC